MAIDDNTSYELTGYQVKDLASKVRAKADSSSLASVATSGLYSDLTGAPTIPTVYNGALTIQHNGTTKGTFTANQSTASTVNIETIYADDYISTSPIPTTVTTAMIEDGAVTTAKIDDEVVTAAKIDWSTIYDELYNSSTETGKNTTFNISTSAASYTRLRVFFKSNDGDFGSVDVYNPDGKTFSTTILHPVTGVIYIKNTLWSISGSTITMGKAVQGMLGNTTSVSDASYIYIVRVEGWKI